MSDEESNVLTEILANALIIGLFLWFLVAGQAAGHFVGPAGVQVQAVLVLKLIGVSTLMGIALAILMAIIWQVITGERPDLTRAERDRAISGPGWKLSMIGTAAGFVGGIVALASGSGVILGLNLMLAGCAFGAAAGNLAKFRACRRGL